MRGENPGPTERAEQQSNPTDDSPIDGSPTDDTQAQAKPLEVSLRRAEFSKVGPVALDSLTGLCGSVLHKDGSSLTAQQSYFQ